MRPRLAPAPCASPHASSFRSVGSVRTEAAQRRRIKWPFSRSCRLQPGNNRSLWKIARLYSHIFSPDWNLQLQLHTSMIDLPMKHFYLDLVNHHNTMLECSSDLHITCTVALHLHKSLFLREVLSLPTSQDFQDINRLKLRGFERFVIYFPAKWPKKKRSRA